MKIYCILLLFSIISPYVLSTPLNWRTNSIENLEKIISDIPKEDRKDFVKQCIANVLKVKYENDEDKSKLTKINNLHKFKALKVSSEAEHQLYDLVQTNYALTDDDLLRYVTYGPICFPSGCVDPGDIGSLCCPFMINKLPIKY